MFLLPDDYLEIKKTRNKGRGVFARKEIKKEKVIGDYIGMIVHPRDVSVDENNFYLTYYHDTAVIVPDLDKPGVHFLNHSCSPNAFIYIYRGHTLVFALKNIKAEEEITISYLLPPKEKYCDPCPHKCNCGNSKCSETMHLSRNKYLLWKKINEKKSKETKRERIRYGEDLKVLKNYPEEIPQKYIEEVNKIFSFNNLV